MQKITLSYNFESEDELRAHLGGETRTDAVVVGSTSPVAVTTAPEAVLSTDAVDADGMRYNADIHANPPTVTADGLWRARKGKAEAATAARAAFKAAGGTVVAPVIATTMPGIAPISAMPGLPTTAPVRQEPVTMEQVSAKAAEVIANGKANEQTFGAIYAKLGVTDVNVFATNESLRAAMLAEMSLL